MSERHTHQAAATTSHTVATALSAHGGDEACWAPTVLFYLAVHLVDARRADDNLHTASHDIRWNDARRYGSDPRASANYKRLWDLSMDWRYKGRRPRSDEVTAAWKWTEALADSLGEPWPPT